MVDGIINNELLRSWQKHRPDVHLSVMKVLESLDKIHQPWLTKVSYQLAKGEELRAKFEQLLDRFFGLLRQAVQSGDPEWLDPVLDEWAEARTQTELESLESSLPPILNHILMRTYAVATEQLSADESLALIGAILPVFLHAYEYASQKEMTLNIEHISRDLEEATATLERLDKSKSDFIAIAAHELKTPLTLIEGYTAMLRDQFAASDEFMQAEILLKGMDNGSMRLREIVDDMIDVSLIDNNILSLHFQPVWVNRLIKVLQEEFTQAIEERNQSLQVRTFPGAEEMTFGDDERLYQALRNVLSNAIKYTPDGGNIKIDGRKLPGFVEIIVMDTGIGIDPEDQTIIFEKFGRLGSSTLHSSGKTKFKGGGPGLGLPITKGIIEAHGGAIWVESKEYNEIRCPGSTFHILLPIRKVPPDDRTAKLFSPISENDLAELS